MRRPIVSLPITSCSGTTAAKVSHFHNTGNKQFTVSQHEHITAEPHVGAVHRIAHAACVAPKARPSSQRPEVGEGIQTGTLSLSITTLHSLSGTLCVCT